MDMGHLYSKVWKWNGTNRPTAPPQMMPNNRKWRMRSSGFRRLRSLVARGPDRVHDARHMGVEVDNRGDNPRRRDRRIELL